MKQRLTLAVTFLLAAFFVSAQDYKNLAFPNPKPIPGSTIQFEYITSGTELGESKDFDAVAYIYDGQLRAQDVKLTSKGDKWKGEVTTNDTTKAVFLVFKKDRLMDNNREQGYSLMMFTKKGEPVKGAYAAVADVSGGMGPFLMRLKVEPAKNLELYDKEFGLFPDLKEKMIVSYAALLARVDKATAKEKIQPYVDKLDAKKKTETEYQTVMWVYQRVGDKAAADKLKTEITEKFPKGEQVRMDKVTAFNGQADLVKKEELLNAYITEYPAKTENEKRSIGNMYGAMASAAATKKDWDMFKKYEAMVTNKENLAGTYNNIAWGLSGESIAGEAKDLAKAKELSGKSLAYLKESMDNPSNKPPFYTDKEYKNNLKFSYGMYGDTYALILWKSGEKEAAYKQQEEAIKNMNMGDAEANERFIVFKSELKGAAAVKDDIVGYIKDGKSSPKLKEILKESYIKEGHTEAEFTNYVDGLMAEYRVKLRADLMKKMINQAAPQFALKDLSGNTVSLNDLKGKVVVVDFWATWCGPCKASFPGMQIALNKYKNDPDVKFVFVDTWESKKPEEMLKNADEFITKNKYGFQVLLDTDDKTVANFGVEGIPTKFVIDGQSMIRFKSVGFDGSADKLVDEISIMVDVLKPGSEKKGF